MFTIMEHQADPQTGSLSADDRLLSKEYDADDESILQKEHMFRQQLQLLAAKDNRVTAFVTAFSQDQPCMPSVLDFVTFNQYG